MPALRFVRIGAYVLAICLGIDAISDGPWNVVGGVVAIFFGGVSLWFEIRHGGPIDPDDGAIR